MMDVRDLKQTQEAVQKVQKILNRKCEYNKILAGKI